jgi:hypothetical protein
LLENGSQQENIWGADWLPQLQEVQYRSVINIRPKQNNPSMEILDPALRERICTLVKAVFEGVETP